MKGLMRDSGILLRLREGNPAMSLHPLLISSSTPSIKSKIPPSGFQLALFLYDSDMVLATPLPLPLNKAFTTSSRTGSARDSLGFLKFVCVLASQS